MTPNLSGWTNVCYNKIKTLPLWASNQKVDTPFGRPACTPMSSDEVGLELG